MEGHRLFVEDLVGALREGRTPRIPGAEARNAVRIILAAYESAAASRPVRI